MLAALNGHEEIVEILIDKHANVNAKDAKGMTAFMHALKGNHSETINLIRPFVEDNNKNNI